MILQLIYLNKKIEFCNKYDESNWNVTLIDTGLNTLKVGRIKQVEKYLDPNVNMVTYCDAVADININELVKFHKSHGKIIIFNS